MTTPTIYLAGPEVFLPNAAEIGRKKKELCERYGFTGLFPLDNEVDPSLPGADRTIYRGNIAMIDQATAGIFNLSPFRGVSADVGTVFELGRMIALGRPCFAYTNIPEDLLDRIKRNEICTQRDTTYFDHQGYIIEPFRNCDNLMIDASLADQGHPIRRPATGRTELIDDLTLFEECLKDFLITQINTQK